MPFNHFDEDGHARMVDVSTKEPTLRSATARAVVHLGPQLLAKLDDRGLAKGDVRGVARLAGISAAKKTPDLIPLAHPLALHQVSVDFAADPAAGTLSVSCTVTAMERTGVEMEAMTGAAVSALTVYDMCKGEDKGISIADLRLLKKSGGKSGDWQAPGEAE